MVRDRPFFLLFDLVDNKAGFDRQVICDGGGGRGSSNTNCTTDGEDRRLGAWLAPSRRDAGATRRTTARRAERRGEERVEEVAGRFVRDGDEAIRWLDLRLGRLSTRTGGRHCWERNESILEGSVEKSVVGDDRDSTESSVGLVIVLTLILSGRGVGGGVMV